MWPVKLPLEGGGEAMKEVKGMLLRACETTNKESTNEKKRKKLAMFNLKVKREQVRFEVKKNEEWFKPFIGNNGRPKHQFSWSVSFLSLTYFEKIFFWIIDLVLNLVVEVVKINKLTYLCFTAVD